MWLLLLACVDEPAPAADSSGPVGVDTPVDSGDSAPPTDTDSGTACTELLWYADTDADTWGDPAGVVSACEAPTGYVARAGDCDDTEAAVSPDGVETCNDRDDDCDLSVDEEAVDAFALHADADGDDFGAAASFLGCAGDGVLDDSDCDDGDAAVNPDAEEVCGDGVDNNCDGAGCGIGGVVSVAVADVTLDGADAVGELGTAVLALSDADGDGLSELVLGAPGPGARYTGPGTTWVDPALVDDTVDGTGVRIGGTTGDDAFGTGLADAGDVDGDGRADLWISAPETRLGASGVYLFHAPFAPAEAADAAVTLTGSSGLYAGSDLSSGDVTGDGRVDLLIASGWSGSGREGAVWIVSAEDFSDAAFEDVGLAWSGEAAGDTVHWNDAGDVDGDGVDDLLAGAYAAASTFGRAYLVLGPIEADGALADADSRLLGETRGDYAGRTARVLEDLDGDGLRELGVGAPSRPSGVYQGRYYVVSGTVRGDGDLADAWMIVDGEGGADYLGIEADSGDVDGDGATDLVLSAYGYASAGRVYAFSAPVGGSVGAASADGIIDGAGGDSLGHSFAVADFDGDGIDDVAAGAPARSGQTGAAVVFWGGSL